MCETSQEIKCLWSDDPTKGKIVETIDNIIYKTYVIRVRLWEVYHIYNTTGNYLYDKENDKLYTLEQINRIEEEKNYRDSIRHGFNISSEIRSIDRRTNEIVKKRNQCMQKFFGFNQKSTTATIIELVGIKFFHQPLLILLSSLVDLANKIYGYGLTTEDFDKCLPPFTGIESLKDSENKIKQIDKLVRMYDNFEIDTDDLKSDTPEDVQLLSTIDEFRDFWSKAPLKDWHYETVAQWSFYKVEAWRSFRGRMFDE